MDALYIRLKEDSLQDSGKLQEGWRPLNTLEKNNPPS